MENEIEEWRSIPGFEDIEAEASSLGRIRAKPGKRGPANTIRSQSGRGQGYLQVGLGGKTYSSHVLVCLAFCGIKPSELHQVAHNNGVRTDNRPSNLRWALPVENHLDKVIHGTLACGESHGMAKVTNSQVQAIREEYAATPVNQRSQRLLGLKYGLSQSHISYIICETGRNNLR